ncbi:DUF5590 domain-containing protein [Streptococcus sp. WM07]|uniref:cell wall elongation regulator TseB-like domain-containing protein n=2 Tax=unclassified Streptococcus TaxID=2608887 RepID=UPI001071A471|nr:DUF5590 domain-containing protein [Streptococcus sp. WM07]
MKKIVYLEPYFPKGQFFLGIFAILSIICFSSLYLIDLGTKTQDVRMSNAQIRAQELAGFREIESVEVFNGQESYTTVFGKNTVGQDQAIILNSNQEQVALVDLNQGVSRSEAEQLASEAGADPIQASRLGYDQGKVVWEVRSGTAYYLIDFQEKKLIRKEGA